MTLLQLIACVGMTAGAFLLFQISPMQFTDGLFRFLTRKPKNIRDEINEVTKRKKRSFLRREIIETQKVLAMTGQSERFPMVCMVSLLLFVLGVCVAILMQNGFLIPVLALGLMLLPFWQIRLTSVHYRRNVAAELETALSIITTAYLRHEDILTAVEENIDYLNPPVRRVFAEFLTRLKLVDPDVETAIEDMKPKIQNDVFHEWCDAISSCQYDRNLKTTLTPIVNNLSDTRTVNAELDYLVAEPRKEFAMMVLLVIGNIPILYFLNKDWYAALMFTPVGQGTLAVCAAVIFFSVARVIRLTKPIEYKR
ncbi:type II secretion system F family protein [Caproiciproducens sp. CPB-2]|uniref:type II secretion system F family protein n=1 Tax=Caproiciproducens sp. CPB-2 TaxID=3030017 RepID=UPI0023DA8098|nr:hypothetical protein [Caproiciproducens sp. CPB-2]MDF1493793.1 hypothetical protein [Caproiciproducens sp. CPB-2]